MTVAEDAWDLYHSCIERGYKPIKFTMGPDTECQLRVEEDFPSYYNPLREPPTLFGVPYEIDVSKGGDFLGLRVMVNLTDLTISYSTHR